MTAIPWRRARQLIDRFSRQQILVVGDVMLDRYLYGSVDRISPEAPVPVLRVTREKMMPGGAANVAANIRSLGARAALAGVIGDDAAGRDLCAVLAEDKIDTTGLAIIPEAVTTVKMRIVAERQQVVRVDWEKAFQHRQVPRHFALDVASRIREMSGVVMADYGKGVLDQRTVDTVAAAGRRLKRPVALDPKDNHDLRLKWITVVTPNCKEAHVCAGLPARTSIPGDPLADDVLQSAAACLLKKWNPEQLIITLGAQGMYLKQRRGSPELIPTRAREVFDVSGAGDTVIAACLLSLAAGASFREAAILGNCAAGVVVGKLGTASCSPEELLEAAAGGVPLRGGG